MNFIVAYFYVLLFCGQNVGKNAESAGIDDAFSGEVCNTQYQTVTCYGVCECACAVYLCWL